MPANYRPAASVDPGLLAAEFNASKNQARQEPPGTAADEPDESGNPAADLRAQVLSAKKAQADAAEKAEKTEASGAAGVLDLKARAKEYLLDSIPLYNGYRALKKLLTGQKIFQGILNIILILFTNFYAILVIFGALALFVIIVVIAESKLVQVTLKILGAVLSIFGSSFKAITDLL